MQYFLFMWLTAHSIALAHASEPEMAICEQLTDEQKVHRIYPVDAGNRVLAVYGKIMTFGYDKKYHENHYVVLITIDKYGVWPIGNYVWTPGIKVTQKNIKRIVRRIESLNYQGEN